MYTLLARLVGSKLSPSLRVGLYLIVAIGIGFLLHDVVYGVIIGGIGAFSTWRQTRKTSFAAAPVVPEPPLPQTALPQTALPLTGLPQTAAPPPAPPAGPVAAPPSAPEGPSIYGSG